MQVDNLWFPIDFVIMDIKENKKVPLVFARKFMQTSWMTIKVDYKQMTMVLIGRKNSLQWSLVTSLPHQLSQLRNIYISNATCLNNINLGHSSGLPMPNYFLVTYINFTSMHGCVCQESLKWSHISYTITFINYKLFTLNIPLFFL